MEKSELLEDVTMYRCIVGNLIYLTIARPYLSYIVGLVSQFMRARRKPHLVATRSILRYVKSTLHNGIFMRLGVRYKNMGTQMLTRMVVSKIGDL